CTDEECMKLIIESKIFDDLDKIFYKNALLIYKGG
ncbi:amidohydrolase, partial [Campylobacter coli]